MADKTRSTKAHVHKSEEQSGVKAPLSRKHGNPMPRAPSQAVPRKFLGEDLFLGTGAGGGGALKSWASSSQSCLPFIKGTAFKIINYLKVETVFLSTLVSSAPITVPDN